MEHNEKLKSIRVKLNLSQAEMAGKLGIKQSYYSAIERGEKNISANVISNLINNLGVSAHWYYNSIGDMFSNANGSTFKGGEDQALYETVKLAEKFYSENLSMKEFGARLLKEASLLEDKSLFYYLKSADEIGKERPDLQNVRRLTENIIVDIGTVKQIAETYFAPILTQDIKYSNYDDFKAKRIANFEKMLAYKKVLPVIAEHLQAILKAFKKHDVNHIIDSTFDASKDK